MQKYYNFKNKYNLEVTKHSTLWDYLGKVSLIIQCFSTCSVEALMMNKPVLSMINLLGKRSADIIHKDYTTNYLESILWQPNSLDELFEIIKLNKSNKIQAVPDINLKNNFLEYYYNFNSLSSTCVIGNEIIDLLNAKVNVKFKKFNLKNFIIKSLAEIYYILKIYSNTDYHLSKYRFKDLILINNLEKFLNKSF